MQRQSPLRRAKRATMKQNKVTFTDRVQESIRTGASVRPVAFKEPPKKQFYE